MSTKTLAKLSERMPSVFDDYFKPWNEWFDNSGLLGRTMNVPSVNITEHKNEYQVSLAAPGLKKDDFKIDVDGNMLTISSEKEESKEEKDKRFTRKEYSYSSFCSMIFTAGTFMVLCGNPPSNHSFHGLKKSSNTDGTVVLNLANALVDIITSFVF